MTMAQSLIKLYLPLFVGAVLLRLLLMPFLFHPDTKTHYFHAQFLSQGVVNIYKYVDDNKTELAYKDTFNYPPLTYFALGSWATITKPFLGPGFSGWLSNWSETWFTDPAIFHYLFLLKLPYLFFDLATGVVLGLLVSERYRKQVLTVWFFNPISLYIIYALANFDIVPTFLTVVSMYWFLKHRYASSAIALGLSIGLKVFPVLFVPFFLIAFMQQKQWKQAIQFLLIMALVVVVPLLLVYPDFLTISQSGLLTKVLENKLLLGSLAIPYFALLYGLVLIYSFWQKNRGNHLVIAILATLASIYVVTPIHPQWLLWGLPLIILVASRHWVSLLILGSLFLGYFLQTIGIADRFITIGIYSPVLPQIYDTGFFERTLFTHVNKDLFTSVAHTIFAVSMVAIVFMFRNYQNEIE